MDGVINIIIVGGVAAAITYFAMRSEMIQEAKNRKSEIESLEQRIDAYDRYLTKDCKYERPFRRHDRDWLVYNSMREEYEYHRFMEGCSEYEADNEGARVKGCVDIDGALYDLRESKYNELAIENYKNKAQLADLKTRVHFCEWIIMELEEKDEKGIEKAWKRISKKAKIAKAIPSYESLLCVDLSNEITDVDKVIANAKKRGKIMTDDQIDELKEQSEEQAARNALIFDFQEYLEHEYCDDEQCRSDEKNEKKCRELRKRFQRYEEDESFEF